MNKRVIYIISTLSYFICLLGINELKHFFNSNTYLYTAYFLFSLIFIYLLYFKYRSHEAKWTVFETVLSIIIFDFSSFIFLANYEGISYYVNLAFITTLTIFYYLYVASSNIFLVSLNERKRLSLLEPATLFLFIGQVLILFFSMNWIYGLQLLPEYPLFNLLIKLVFIFILYLYLFNLEFSHPDILIKAEDKSDEAAERSLLLLNAVRYSAILINVFLALIITFYPFSNYWREIFLTVVFYISFNYINLYLNNRLGKNFLINTGLAFIASLLFILAI